MVDFADVDALAAGYQQRGGQPGLAYGIVVGGEPAVCNNGPECPEEECRRDRWLRTISRA